MKRRWSMARAFSRPRRCCRVCTHLKGLDKTGIIAPHRAGQPLSSAHYPDFADVKGQQQVKRALEIAGLRFALGADGRAARLRQKHAGRALPRIVAADERSKRHWRLPRCNRCRPVSTSKNWKQRPFRCPRHTCSGVALVGGGNVPRPGEISLAHGGVLFLDELPEFDRRVLEVLRQPLESGRITISRAAHQADFPANFLLIAAMNPCPCGWLGHVSGKCRCTGEAVLRYQARISGPVAGPDRPADRRGGNCPRYLERAGGGREQCRHRRAHQGCLGDATGAPGQGQCTALAPVKSNRSAGSTVRAKSC